MAKRDNTGDWTVDELLAELRFRERAGMSRLRGAQPPRRSAPEALRAMDTRTLVKTLRGRQRVVYGTDNRRDVFRVTQASVRSLADAVAAVVNARDLEEHPDGSVSLATESYRDAYNLCGNEPFASQPIGCFCSAFLVAPDVVATAGHCLKPAQLSAIRFVFGFRMVDANTARTTFRADDVYRAAKLIERQLNAKTNEDWALVRLDRPVVGRKPVKVRTAGQVKTGAPLFVIGHPNGLPAKFADGANVRENANPLFFVANLDTYGGNSGSPVFHRTSKVVEGILVRGETDFVSNGQCAISLVCPNTGCRGEDVTRSTVWAAKLPKSRRRPRT